MVVQANNTHDLVVPSNFVLAVRESGYVSLSTALAELIDNSIQAGASKVAVSISGCGGGDPLPQIVVEDDGAGMNERELMAALRFGGSARFDERQSFGRFGMGLPAASLSQTRRVEVIAWQSDGVERSVSLDVDALVAGAPADFSVTVRNGASTSSGCRVIWHDCDRIEYKRLGWLTRALRRELGRMYRRFLGDGLTLTINGVHVAPLDPMLLDVKSVEGSARLAFEPLVYEIEMPGETSATVTVRFALLPVHAWHSLDNETKRRLGIVSGGGVSVLRAGREIAHGWHLMGGKRKENYDDWWRCEVEFSPDLDEHFGITINKQGIRPSQVLREVLEPELEAIARMLNSQVRQAFEDVKFQASASRSCDIASATELELAPLSANRGSRPISYRIGSGVLSSGQMLAAELHQGTLDVLVNVDHPAFTALYRPLQTLADSSATDLRIAVELLLLAHVRTTFQLGLESSDLLQIWSETYGRMLQRT